MITAIKRSQPTPFAVFHLKAYVLRPSAPTHGACGGVREILHTTPASMIRTLLTETDIGWRVFNYEFEQVDEAEHARRVYMILRAAAAL